MSSDLNQIPTTVCTEKNILKGFTNKDTEFKDRRKRKNNPHVFLKYKKCFYLFSFER